MKMTRRFPWGSRELQVHVACPDPPCRDHRPRANYHVFFQEYVADGIDPRLHTALALGALSWALIGLLSALIFRMTEVYLDLGGVRFHAATTKALES